MPNIGLPEILIVLVIALVIFGPKKLPDLGRSLGTGMREFKDSITGANKDDDKPAEIAPSGDEPSTAEQHDDAVSRPRG
jgi:sec-independent protein translocase protein TatA